jgi:hypothetical protein
MEKPIFSTQKKDKLYNDISDMAQYYRQTRQTQRLNLIISVMYNLLILLFVVGSIMAVIKSGTLGSLFGDKLDLTRRFNCVSGEVHDTLKSYTEANYFIQMYNGSCTLYFENNKVKN